ncbi:UDP-glycosyltransferase 83A1-like [Daucus carota subsp. sativus]|uniref:UDP-glycosyltransferase 83A1-like n=1 Tax=Daucus carota subsp. sativus TaxID=79200 RepID=UPI0007F045A2|nr:PREDICTED: UDP-glycosyltransferase 83A1-like [Daucus carota subsp. sativus]
MDLPQHVLVVPSPAQGHVKPLMKLAYNLAYHGIKVTFANSQFVEANILAAMSEADKEQCPIRLVSYSDGLEACPEERNGPGLITSLEERNGPGLITSLKEVMPKNVEKLIEQINQPDNKEPITCVIGDLTAGWTLEVARKMGLKQVAVWPAGPASLALALRIPQLIEAGVIDENGSTMKNELICLSEEIPVWNSWELTWISPGKPALQKILFDFSLAINQVVKNPIIVLCNTYYELDSSSCAMIPGILPIGPLPAISNLNPCSGSFLSQDSTCLSWLDKRPPNSVIYIAFGSTAVFSQKQFDELALGLELSGHSFLWVVRPNIVSGSSHEYYPDNFLERIASRGMIVKWAPQEKVLAHPSISCFFSHCGWNSTMEGVSNGVPFLCWPYLWDQFDNKKYICEMWKVGLALDCDEDGIISRHEIKTKIHNLVTNDGMKMNAKKLMEDAKKSVSQGGGSYENFKSLVKYLGA